jgi:hypothetical protein
VYVRVPNAEERESGAPPLTQFGRMCAALGITIIPASSPQAKGRIERQHGTHQDRLVKKLRRRGIRDVSAANAFLATAYWPEHNARFAQAAASAEDFHTRAPSATVLARLFRLETERTVGNDWVVRYHNRCLQLERQSHHPPARSRVQIAEAPSGAIEIRYRGRVMRWTEIPPGPRASSIPALPPTRDARTLTTRRLRPNVSRDHPWYQGAAEYEVSRQVAKDRRAWARVQP